MQAVFQRFGDRFLQRVYTIAEQEEFHQRLISPARSAHRPSTFSKATLYLAGRWAAKEAVVKAIGTGWSGIHYTDVAITTQTSGAPLVTLVPRPATQSFLQGTWQLSLSHDGDYAIATALWIAAP